MLGCFIGGGKIESHDESRRKMSVLFFSTEEHELHELEKSSSEASNQVFQMNKSAEFYLIFCFLEVERKI